MMSFPSKKWHPGGGFIVPEFPNHFVFWALGLVFKPKSKVQN